MSKPSQVLLVGVLLGSAGACGQVYLLHANSPHTVPLRGLLTFSLAVLVGAFAGLAAGREALKAAGLAGFVAGFLSSSVGLAVLIRSPTLLGANPFASIESALSFVSSILAGTMVSSWLIAGVAILIALPISQALTAEKGIE